MTDQDIVALFDDKIGPPAFEFADKRIVAFANALLRKKEEEIIELHARLAGANLRADIGWSRYENANTARINAEKCLSQTWNSLLSRAIPEGHVVVPKEPTIEMIAALGFGGDVAMAIGHAAISETIANNYRAALSAAPAPEGEA